MSWNQTTLNALDKAIDELSASIEKVNEQNLKTDLMKKLKSLKKTRESMTPNKKLSTYYMIMIPVCFLFITLGLFYFLYSGKRKE